MSGLFEKYVKDAKFHGHTRFKTDVETTMVLATQDHINNLVEGYEAEISALKDKVSTLTVSIQTCYNITANVLECNPSS